MRVVVPASPPTSYHWDAVEPQEVSAALQCSCSLQYTIGTVYNCCSIQLQMYTIAAVYNCKSIQLLQYTIAL